jgi:hypothetical protein
VLFDGRLNVGGFRRRDRSERNRREFHHRRQHRDRRKCVRGVECGRRERRERRRNNGWREDDHGRRSRSRHHDTTKIGSTGYSRGGGGAISVGSNARIQSTFFFASNGNVGNLKAPWGVVGGDMDTTFDWSAISGAVTGSGQPAFGAALAGVDHNRVAGNGKAQEAFIAWMRWRFMNDPSGRSLFVGADCQLCTDPAFSGIVKTPALDAL